MACHCASANCSELETTGIFKFGPWGCIGSSFNTSPGGQTNFQPTAPSSMPPVQVIHSQRSRSHNAFKALRGTRAWCSHAM
eukprot:3292516-Rhodomonas_salina.1